MKTTPWDFLRNEMTPRAAENCVSKQTPVALDDHFQPRNSATLPSRAVSQASQEVCRVGTWLPSVLSANEALLWPLLITRALAGALV